jgi:uncharacterized lipoprotein YbaY
MQLRTDNEYGCASSAPRTRRRLLSGLRRVLAVAAILGAISPEVHAQGQINDPSGTYIRRFETSQAAGWMTIELNANHSAILTTIDESQPLLHVQAGVWIASQRLVVVRLLVDNARLVPEQLVLVPVGKMLITAEWDAVKYGNDPLVFTTAAAVTGTVTYLEKIALSPQALIEIRLLDTTGSDGSTTIVGRRVIAAAGRQVPIPFEVWYDPAVINPRDTYTVQARIFEGNQLLFTTTQPKPVITQGNPTTGVEITMERPATTP